MYLTFGGENFLIWKICLGTESHEVSYCKHNDNTTAKNQYLLQNFSSNEIIYLRCILYQAAFDAKLVIAIAQINFTWKRGRFQTQVRY